MQHCHWLTCIAWPLPWLRDTFTITWPNIGWPTIANATYFMWWKANNCTTLRHSRLKLTCKMQISRQRFLYQVYRMLHINILKEDICHLICCVNKLQSFILAHESSNKNISMHFAKSIHISADKMSQTGSLSFLTIAIPNILKYRKALHIKFKQLKCILNISNTAVHHYSVHQLVNRCIRH